MTLTEGAAAPLFTLLDQHGDKWSRALGVARSL